MENYLGGGSGSGSGSGSGGDCTSNACALGELDAIDVTSEALRYVSAASMIAVASNGNDLEVDDFGLAQYPRFPPLARAETLRFPLSEPDGYGFKPTVSRTGDGGVILWTPVSVFRLGPSWLPVQANAALLASDGSVVTCDGTTIQATAPHGGTITHAWSHGACTGIAGPLGGVHFVSAGGTIYRYDPIAGTYIAELSGNYWVSPRGTDVWASGYVGGAGDRNALRREAGTFVAKPVATGCVILQLRTDAAQAYALVRCGAETRVDVWADATGWTAISDPIDAGYLGIGLDGTVFTWGNGPLHRLAGTAWSDLGPPLYNDYALRAADNVYGTSSSSDLVHLDGTIVAPIAISRFPGSPVALPHGLLVQNAELDLLTWWGPEPSGL